MRPCAIPRARLVLAACAGVLGALPVAAHPIQSPSCHFESVGGDLAGNAPVGNLAPSLSADGRYVAYFQGPFPSHVFVHDRLTGTKAFADSLPDGTPFDGSASGGGLSADGRFVAFLATAPITGVPNTQVYRKDLVGGGLETVTIRPDGQPMTATGQTIGLGPTPISANGDRIVFTTNSQELAPGKTTFWRDVFVRDVATATTKRLLGAGGVEPDGPALFHPALSADGRLVAFASRAKNLVPGDTNQRGDVFVHDLASGVTVRISLSSGGAQGNHDSEDPVISADGRFVAFASRASNLVPGDTNGLYDIFVHDRTTGRTRRVNVASDGTQADGSSSRTPRLSASGRIVLFHSLASNLGTGVLGGRLYTHDLASGLTELVTPLVSGPENDVCALSAEGDVIAFATVVPIGPDDTNNTLDTIVRDCTD